jgi:hypothetical protein
MTVRRTARTAKLAPTQMPAVKSNVNRVLLDAFSRNLAHNTATYVHRAHSWLDSKLLLVKPATTLAQLANSILAVA